jgi:hypothetical protein
MVLQGCSDVVDSRAGHLFSMPKAAGMQLLLRIGNSPGALVLGDARTSDNDPPRRVGLSIDEVEDLSIDGLNCSGGRVGRRIQAQRFNRIHQNEYLAKSKRRSVIKLPRGFGYTNRRKLDSN